MRSSTDFVALTIFCRAPEPGRVKTRLIPEVGPGGAAALHAAFADDVCALTRPLEARRTLAVDGPLDHPAIIALAAREGMPIVPQGEGDLGARMDRAIASGLAAGARACFLLGTDSPALPPELVAEALALAGAAEVVVGPAEDGGYWTIGATRALPELFRGMAWGTPAVLPETLARLADGTAKLALAPRFWDVDEPADLARLARHLVAHPRAAPASRAALELWYRRSDAG